jgi:hypothetical protein
MGNVLGHVIIFSAAFLAPLTLIPQLKEACAPPPPGMIGWWPGDSNTNEIIAGRHGATRGSATFATGKVASAFKFDRNGWVEVPDNSIWTLGAEDFTIDLWAQFHSLSGRDPFVGHDDGGGANSKWIFWYDTSGHDKQPGAPALRFHVYSFSRRPNAHDAVVARWRPALNRWYHVAVTRSGDQYALYIDGAEVATDRSSYPILDPSFPLTIGRAEHYRFDGLVDELEIFRRALSQDEILSLFFAGSAGKCKPKEVFD